MASLNTNGQHIGQLNYTAKNTGSFIKTTRQFNDSLIDSVSTLSYTIHPAKISSLVLWLDASDFSTMTIDASNIISKWIDKASNKAFVRSTTLNLPVLNKTTRTAKFSDAFMECLNGSIISSTPFTIFAVVNHPSTGISETDAIISFNANNNNYWSLEITADTNIGNINRQSVAEGSDIKSTTNTVSSFNSVLFTELASTSNAKIEIDNDVANGTTSSVLINPVTIDRMGIGGNKTNNRFNGGICEILVFNAVLSATQKRTILAYLRDKWNLSLKNNPIL